MSDELDLQDILDTQAHFDLPSPALVEKDFYVVKALRAIALTDTTPFLLAFGGGTALSRAHRLLPRMSEDIDLKIVGEEPITRPALRQLRDSLTKSLQDAGFEFDPSKREHRDSRNESRYTIFRLPYQALSRGEGALRPGIQIEAAVWPLRRPSIRLPVSSFVAEAFKKPPEVDRIECVSITQTAAEKFVALTRRVAIEQEGTRAGDPADIRHVYDLHMLSAHYDFDEVAALAQEIMPHDAEVFGHHSPAYSDDPRAGTLRAVAALESEADYARRYSEFCRAMVYGDRPEYADALKTVLRLSERIRTDSRHRTGQ